MKAAVRGKLRDIDGFARGYLLTDGRGRRPITATDRPFARESDRDLEALSTVYTVHGKVPSVSREDSVGFQVFSDNNQRGVCEVHRAIRILHHQLARAAEGRGACQIPCDGGSILLHGGAIKGVTAP